MKTIQYAIDSDTGLVISRVGSELAWPILNYDGMLPENNYTIDYNLEKIPICATAGYTWNLLKWTRKIPKAIKETHREFWGFAKLN